MYKGRISLILGAVAAFLTTSAVAGPQPKVDVCHPAGNSGNVLTLNVNANSLGGHLGHGDWLPTTWFVDADGDGYGDAGDTIVACEQPAGTTTNGDDCDDSDDSDDTTNPGADEVCGDAIDNNCDGQVDEDCTSDIELMISADNAYMVWIDGIRYTPEFQYNWQKADWITVTVPAGDHTVAVYAEDWGVVAYFAATLWVDGVLVSQTGDGTWLTDGTRIVGSQNWWDRTAVWDTTSPLSAPANWTDVSYDDSSWFSAPTCHPSTISVAGYAAITSTAFDDFDTFLADGTEMIWTRANCRTPYSPWYTGVFRNNFSTP
jgi:hypothetical protein